MKLKIYSTLFLVLCINTINAQQSFVATGNSITNAYGSISFSIGQIVGENIINTNAEICNGIQYPYDIYKIYGNLITPLKKGIKNVMIGYTNTQRQTKLQPTVNYDINLPNGVNSIKPQKNNDINKANGVTSVDVLLTQRHILNTTKLNSPYKIIAADVTGDKQINSTDVLRMKRLILGTDTTFTKTVGTVKTDRLWEFVDSAYVFPDTTNPFPFKDSISFTNLTSNKTNQTFIGVKLGDVNYDWNPAVARGIAANSLQLSVNSEKKESVIHYNFTSSNFNNINAFQTTLHFDNAKYEFVGIENGKLQLDHNASKANTTGNIALLWTDKNAEAKSYDKDEVLFTLMLKPKNNSQYTTNNLPISINNDISETEAWDNNFAQHSIALTQTLKNDKPQTTNNLLIYPNPAKGSININTIAAAEIQVLDIVGRVIKKENINNQNFNTTYQLKKGSYIIKAIMKDSTVKNEILIVQ